MYLHSMYLARLTDVLCVELKKMPIHTMSYMVIYTSRLLVYCIVLWAPVNAVAQVYNYMYLYRRAVHIEGFQLSLAQHVCTLLKQSHQKLSQEWPVKTARCKPHHGPAHCVSRRQKVIVFSSKSCILLLLASNILFPT